MARAFYYKGVELEQLKKMSVDEFAELLPSKAKRTIKRNNAQTRKFLQKLEKHEKNLSEKPMKTHYREMVVIPALVGNRMQVHDGKNFVDVVIMPEMLGHKLGEYAHPTKLVRHSGPGIGATRGSKAVELK